MRGPKTPFFYAKSFLLDSFFDYIINLEIDDNPYNAIEEIYCIIDVEIAKSDYTSGLSLTKT